MISKWLGLPPESPFTKAIVLVIYIQILWMLLALVQVGYKVIVAGMLREQRSLLFELKALLVAIKEWAQIARENRKATVEAVDKLGVKIDSHASQVQEAVNLAVPVVVNPPVSDRPPPVPAIAIPVTVPGQWRPGDPDRRTSEVQDGKVNSGGEKAAGEGAAGVRAEDTPKP